MRQYQNNILITGANGTLGNAFKQHYQKSHKVMGTSRSILDFNSGSNVDKFVSQYLRTGLNQRKYVQQNLFFPTNYNGLKCHVSRQKNIADRPDKRRGVK